jgi:hypothetical protein
MILQRQSMSFIETKSAKMRFWAGFIAANTLQWNATLHFPYEPFQKLRQKTAQRIPAA